MPRRIGRSLTLAIAAAAVGSATPALAAPATERVSVGPGGAQGDEGSYQPDLSSTGRFVAFSTRSSTLVRGDTNGQQDVFVRDRRTGTTERISVGPGGAQGDSASYNPALSADGRYVAFESGAGNLVPGDTNGSSDVFVRDRRTRRTTRVSVGPGGAQAEGASGGSPALSAPGRLVAFSSTAANLVPGDTNREEDVFIRDLTTGTTTRVSVRSDGAQGNGFSFGPALSADGRFVAFSSDATNLVPGDTNGRTDVFVHDRHTGGTVRASVGPSGVQGDGTSSSPALSADGRVVAFASAATNLVPGDTNGSYDAFVRDLASRTTTRVSVGPGGSQGDGNSLEAAISADGRLVAFVSGAGNLVPGDTNGVGDAFVRDLTSRTTTRASVGPGGAQANDHSDALDISADGRVVGFMSDATNLVPGDTNGEADVFVRTR